MKQMMTMLALMMHLAGAAKAGVPAPVSRAQRLELREGLQGDKRRLKQVGVERLSSFCSCESGRSPI